MEKPPTEKREMTATPDLFTLAAARQARDKGMQRASKHASDEWRDYALDFIEDYARRHREVFVDDLWEAGLSAPVSARALGAVLQEAVKSGWIEKQQARGCVLARASKNSNMQLKPVWRQVCRVPAMRSGSCAQIVTVESSGAEQRQVGLPQGAKRVGAREP